VAAVACVALGTAAVGAVASLLVATLLRPLPFPDGDRLLRVWSTEGTAPEREAPALADLEDLRALDALDRVEGATRERRIFLDESGGRRVEGEGVTGGYFDLLGAETVRGRTFSAAEHGGGSGEGVLVLTHAAWGALFGFDESAVGATVRTPQGPYTVVGVLEPAFTGTIEEDAGEIEFFVPAPTGPESTASRQPGDLWVVARLAPGMTLQEARVQVAALGRRLAGAHPEARARTALELEAMSESWRSGLRRGVWLLLGAAVLLLVVAAANVAGLMLAHGISRRRELAVRAALGASRTARVRLLALEALAVAGVGGAIGLLLGPLCLQAFTAVAPVPVPAYVSLDMDGRAVALTLGILMATTVGAALVPALAASGVGPAEAMTGSRGAARARGEGRLGRTLIVLQVAVATVLVSSTALLLRSYDALQEAELGFRTQGMLRVALFVNEVDAPDVADVADVRERARAAVLARPEVESVGLVWPTAPLVAAPRTRIRYAGMDPRDEERGQGASLFATGPDFFDVMEIPVVHGRGIEAQDREDTEPVVVVSASLAQRLGGPDAALGSTVEVLGAERRVVGVVADALLTGPRAPAGEERALYLPLSHLPQRTVSFAVRTRGTDPGAALPGIRRALGRVAPASALDWTDPFDQALGAAFQRDRFLVALVGVFSAATLALAALGLLALLGYTVARSRVDIGVRRALGATRGRIVAGIVGRAVRLVGSGLLLGVAAASLTGWLLEDILYGVQPLDPLAFATTALVLLGIALVAAVLPARSATRVPPAAAMRDS
jgi:predicted permease